MKNRCKIDLPYYQSGQQEFRLDNVVGAVEGDSFAQTQLWEEWSDNIPDYIRPIEDHRQRVRWEQQSIGTLETIANIDVGEDFGGRMPVCVSLSWVIIDGHRVLFYDPCSMLRHSEVTRAWLDKNLDEDYVHTDAQNFHIIIHYIQRLNGNHD